MLRPVQRVAPTIYHVAQRRRGFFSFPSVKPFTEYETRTQSYHERKILPYRRGELYTIIADVEAYSSFVPYCIGSRILRNKGWQGDIMVMEAELTVGFLAFKESYVSTVTCRPDEYVEAVASSSSPLFKSLTTTWRLEPVSHAQGVPAENTVLDQGPTSVTLDLAFAFSNPMHTTVSATFFGQVSKLMVKAFEQRCIALYGPRFL